MIARKKLAKILSLFIVMASLFTMVACATPTATPTVAPTAGATEPPVDYAWEKYAEPVEITVGLRTDPSVAFKDPADNWDNNVFTREIESLFNIKIKILWSADNANYATKLNVSIASGDLPDIYSPGSSQFIEVAKAGLVADLGSTYEKYASPVLKAAMDYDKVGFESGMYDGKLLGLSSQHWGLVTMPDVVWIRDDWLKKVGKSAPKTMDELIAICEAFTTQDPDGNGKADTHGLAVVKDLIDTNSIVGIASLTGFFNAYHAYPGIWYKDATGSIVNGAVQPEMKTALIKLKEMYENGYLDKEFALKDTAKVAEDMVSSKVGVEFGQNWNGYYPVPDVIKKNGAGAIFMPYAIPSADAAQVKLGVGWPVSMYYVVNKNCKYPDAAIKIANMDISLYNSDPARYKTFLNENSNWCCPVAVVDPSMSDKEYSGITEALKNRDPSKLTGSPLAKYNFVIDWIDNKNPDTVGYWLQVGPESSFAVLADFFTKKNYVYTEYRGVDTASMLKNKATLEKLVNETLTKIIMGAPVEDFDKMVTDWNALGGADMTKEMNDTYNK